VKNNNITEKLKNLCASDRFDVIYGPQKKNIEEELGCKILTMPIEQLNNLPDETTCFTVKDSRQGLTYLAIFQPIN
jgi:hypothetical protein